MEVDGTPTPEISSDIKSLLRSYPSLQYIADKDRVKCTWTEHEMPARSAAILNYIQGKKYQQYLKKKT